MPFREALLLALNSPPGLREALRPVLEEGAGRVTAEFFASPEDLLTRLNSLSRAAAVVVPPVEGAAGPLQTALVRGITVFVAAAEWPPGWAEWRESHPEKGRLHLLRLPLTSAAVPLFTGLAAAETGEPSEELEKRGVELRHCEERFAAGFRAAPFPQAILEFSSGRVVEVNGPFCAVTGFSKAELLIM